MKLYIPTYNRFLHSLAGTLNSWPADLHVYVVVRPEQAQQYKALLFDLRKPGLELLEIGDEGIARTRNAIRGHAGPSPFVMIDDDLEFLKRREDHDVYLRGSKNDEIRHMFEEMHEMMTAGNFAHVAISCREGNNRITEDFADNTRGIRLVGYRGDILQGEELFFDPELEGREDLDMTLKLLTRGFGNRVFYKWAQGQRGSNTTGGLSETTARSDDEMERTAKLLAERHPGLVRARVKTTKTSWGGKPRWDVTCYWKKAYGLCNNNSDIGRLRFRRFPTKPTPMAKIMFTPGGIAVGLGRRGALYGSGPLSSKVSRVLSGAGWESDVIEICFEFGLVSTRSWSDYTMWRAGRLKSLDREMTNRQLLRELEARGVALTQEQKEKICTS